MNLFYQDNIDSKASEIIFDKEESRHIHKVLRKEEGAILHITNGEGYLFTTEMFQVVHCLFGRRLITVQGLL